MLFKKFSIFYWLCKCAGRLFCGCVFCTDVKMQSAEVAASGEIRDVKTRGEIGGMGHIILFFPWDLFNFSDGKLGVGATPVKYFIFLVQKVLLYKMLNTLFPDKNGHLGRKFYFCIKPKLLTDSLLPNIQHKKKIWGLLSKH